MSASGRAPRRPGASGLLRELPFLAVWLAGALISTARWLEMLVVGVFVFDTTDSPFQVALMLVLRMLPLALLGAPAGALAERWSRRRMLQLGLLAMVAVSLGLAGLGSHDAISVFYVALASLLSGVFWAGDMPTRRMLLGDIAGTARVATAMSLDTLTNNGTRMLGPLLGGVMLEAVGLGGAFLLCALLYLAALAALAAASPIPPSASGGGGAVLASMLAGLRFLRRDRALTGLLAVTVIFNLWGFPVVSMIPVIGRDELGLGARAVGILASCEGAGTLIGALLVTMLATLHHFRRLYVLGLALFLGMAIGFSLSRSPELAGALLFALGLGSAAFSSMQSTLIYLNTPAELRSRMMGVLSVCIGIGPLGFAHVGLLAGALGAPLAVAISAAEGLAALALAYRAFPELLAAQALAPQSEPPRPSEARPDGDENR